MEVDFVVCGVSGTLTPSPMEIGLLSAHFPGLGTQTKWKHSAF